VASLAQDKNSLPEVAANPRTQSVCPGTKHDNWYNTYVTVEQFPL
jgi:hypothetical protein